jgi:hypothetical protein
MCLHGGDQVEHVIGKRKVRDGAFNDLDAACCDFLTVGLTGHRDTLFGIVNAIDFPRTGECGQFVHSSSAAAPYVKNGLVFFY